MDDDRGRSRAGPAWVRLLDGSAKTCSLSRATMRDIRRARDLGFSVKEVCHRLSLRRDRDRPSRKVKAIAQEHLADLDARISWMQAMAGAFGNRP